MASLERLWRGLGRGSLLARQLRFARPYAVQLPACQGRRDADSLSSTANAHEVLAASCGMAGALGAGFLTAGTFLWLLFRGKDRIGDDFIEPTVVRAKDGTLVKIRAAALGDIKSLIADVQDRAGVGSGTGDESFLVNMFTKMVDDPKQSVLWAETADGTSRGLGMLTISWCPERQSYWNSLRVSQEARNLRIGTILFHEAAKLTVRFQGPESVSSWGIVSNNEVMVKWSKRLALAGGESFVRHLGKPKEGEAPAGLVPKGWTVRWATLKDEGLISDYVFGGKGDFQVRRSEHGTQNFHGDSCWCYYSRELLHLALSGDKGKISDCIGMMLVFDDKQELVGLSQLAIFDWEGQGKFLLHSYTDGTKEGLSLLFELLLYEGKRLGVDNVMGYVPKLGWMMELLGKSPAYSRATKTEQLEYHWRNLDYAK